MYIWHLLQNSHTGSNSFSHNTFFHFKINFVCVLLFSFTVIPTSRFRQIIMGKLIKLLKPFTNESFIKPTSKYTEWVAKIQRIRCDILESRSHGEHWPSRWESLAYLRYLNENAKKIPPHTFATSLVENGKPTERQRAFRINKFMVGWLRVLWIMPLNVILIL